MTAATSQGISGIRLVTQFLTTDVLNVSRNATVDDLTVTGTADFTQAQSITGIGTIASGVNVGSGAGLYRDSTTVGSTRTLNFRSMASSSDVTVTQDANSIILSLDNTRPFNNLTVSGLSTIGTLSVSGSITGTSSTISGAITYGGSVTGIVPSKLDIAVGGLRPGDLLVYNSSGNLVKLPAGEQGQILTSTGDTLGLSWVTPLNLPPPELEDIIGTQPEGTLVYAQDAALNYGLITPAPNVTFPVGFLRYGKSAANRWGFDTDWSTDAVDLTSPLIRVGKLTVGSINLGTDGTFYTDTTYSNFGRLITNWIIPFNSSSTSLFTSSTDTVARDRFSTTSLNYQSFTLGSFRTTFTSGSTGNDDDDVFSVTGSRVYDLVRRGTTSGLLIIGGFSGTALKTASSFSFQHFLTGNSAEPFFVSPTASPLYPVYSAPFTLETYGSGTTNPTFYTCEVDALKIVYRMPVTIGQSYTIPTIAIPYRTMS